MRSNASAQTNPWKATWFSATTDPNLQDIGTEKVCLVLSLSFAVATNIDKDPRKYKRISTLYSAWQFFADLINRDKFPHAFLIS